MKGEWKVQSNTISGNKQYIACRIIDTSQVVHSGNMEHSGGYSEDRQAVQTLVDELNKKEVEK